MTSSRKEVLLLEPVSGISGDMFLGSLVDLGLDRSWLTDVLEEVLPDEAGIEIWEDNRGGISGTRFRVQGVNDTRHRGLEDIKDLIDDSSLPDGIVSRAVSMFELLAEVEAEVHGMEVEKVHFHEVGALDSIADIVGASAGVWKMDPDRIYSTQVNLGGGSVETAHGKLPVPAPATAELLKIGEVPTFSSQVSKELTTPTGALILETFVDEYFRPSTKILGTGYGLGSYRLEEEGNFLRTIRGVLKSTGDDREDGHEVLLETNIDDMNPELFPVVEEKLLEAGALDVFKTPVQMKKNRPGVKLTVICDRAREDKLAELIFRETTTLGIRIQEIDRKKLDRKTKTVETEFGLVRVKVGYLMEEPVNYSPEFESCHRLAEKNNCTVKKIYREAIARAENQIE